jgi:large-conductance mechanosensitive channel
MGFGEELIIRTAVGTVLGLALNSFLSSFGRDVIKPIISRKGIKNLEREYVTTIFGVKINYGDLVGHFISLLVIVGTVYVTVKVAERYKVI